MIYKLLLSSLMICFSIFTTTLHSQVLIEFGDAELQYDPSTGLPTEDWSVPVLASGGTSPVIAFAFDGKATFSGFLHGSNINLDCAGAGNGDLAAATSSSFSFDLSTGVLATAEFIEIQDIYQYCLTFNGDLESLSSRNFSVGVVESLQAPFTGQTLDVSIPIGSLTIQLSKTSLLNDLNGATISVNPGTFFNPPIVPEVTYLDGTAAPLNGPVGDITFIRANSFKRGTFEAGDLTISDPVRVLLYLFGGGETPSCFDSVDANDDGEVNLGDPVLVLIYLFADGPAPQPPHSQCGSDLSPDSLDCAVDICG